MRCDRQHWQETFCKNTSWRTTSLKKARIFEGLERIEKCPYAFKQSPRAPSVFEGLAHVEIPVVKQRGDRGAPSCEQEV